MDNIKLYLIFFIISIALSSCNIDGPSAKPKNQINDQASKMLQLKDTNVSLSIKFDSSTLSLHPATFSWDGSKYATAIISRNIYLSGNNKGITIWPLSAGPGYLLLLNKDNDTIIKIISNTVLPAGWDDSVILAKKVLDACKGDYNNCDKDASALFNASQWLDRGSYLVNEPIPLFSTKSIKNEIISNTDLLGKTSVLVVYEYGCSACSDLLGELQNSSLRQTDINIVSFCANTCINRNDSIFYASNKKSGTSYKYWSSLPLGKVCSQATAVISKLYAYGYPKVLISDRSGIIRYSYNLYYDGMVNDMETKVAFLNNLDINTE